MPTWEFVEVGKYVSAGYDADPNAHYSYTMREKGINYTCGSSMTFQQLKPLMFHFGVERPSKLAGKSFKSQRKDAHSALNLLIVQIRHGGEYNPPKPQMLYDALAESLAKLQVPDFSDVDDETVFKAFFEWFDGSRMKHDRFLWLKDKIWAQSEGKLLLERADPKEFKMHIMGPAEYLVLTNQGLPLSKPTGDRRRLLVGPYSAPVLFDADK